MEPDPADLSEYDHAKIFYRDKPGDDPWQLIRSDAAVYNGTVDRYPAVSQKTDHDRPAH